MNVEAIAEAKEKRLFQQQFAVLKRQAAMRGRWDKIEPSSLRWLLDQWHRNPQARQLIQALQAPMLRLLCARHRGFAQEVEAPVEAKGRYHRLFWDGRPGELQMRLCYEQITSHFSDWLWKHHHCPTLQQQDGQLVVFVPEGQDFDLEALWQEFLAVLTSKEQLLAGFVLLLNTGKLSARGFSVPEVLLVSPGIRDVMAAWLYSVFMRVKQRIARRARQLASGTLTPAQHKKAEEMQAKELKKYRELMEKAWARLAKEEDKLLTKLAKIEEKLATLKKPSGKGYEKLQAQKEALLATQELSSPDWEQVAQAAHDADYEPFTYLEELRRIFGTDFARVEALSRRFNNIASDQINSARGDIFAAALWRFTCLLRTSDKEADEAREAVPNLFTTTPPASAWREAGDAHNGFCYACGSALRKQDLSLEIRRIIFESPEQRLQNSANPSKPKSCMRCAALSQFTAIKPTDDSCIVRFTKKSQASTRESETQGLPANLKELTKASANKAVRTYAGPYLMIRCTEQVGGDLLSAKIGLLAYTYYKLAEEFAPEVFTQTTVALCTKGNEQVLSSAGLFWLHTLLKASGQGLLKGGSLQREVAKSIRYLTKGIYIGATYTMASLAQQDRHFVTTINAAIPTLIQLLMEENMDAAQKHNHIVGMTGLLRAFVGSLKSLAEKSKDAKGTEDRQKPEKAKKETNISLAKLIEKSGEPMQLKYVYASHPDVKAEYTRLFCSDRNQYQVAQSMALLNEAFDGAKHFEIQETPSRDDDAKLLRYLEISRHDLDAAYAFILRTYPKDYDQRDFFTQLRMSLYSEFPEVLSRYKRKDD